MPKKRGKETAGNSFKVVSPLKSRNFGGKFLHDSRCLQVDCQLYSEFLMQ